MKTNTSAHKIKIQLKNSKRKLSKLPFLSKQDLCQRFRQNGLHKSQHFNSPYHRWIQPLYPISRENKVKLICLECVSCDVFKLHCLQSMIFKIGSFWNTKVVSRACGHKLKCKVTVLVCGDVHGHTEDTIWIRIPCQCWNLNFIQSVACAET